MSDTTKWTLLGQLDQGVVQGFDLGTDKGSKLIILDEVGQIYAIHDIPRSDQMRGRLGNLAAIAVITGLAASVPGSSVFRPGFGSSPDEGSLAKRREEKQRDREAHREERMAKAQAKRNARNAKRRTQTNG